MSSLTFYVFFLLERSWLTEGPVVSILGLYNKYVWVFQKESQRDEL